MSEYTDERNAHIKVLREEIGRRTGAWDSVRDALKWAVRRLEGLPESWEASQADGEVKP
jgi:hypothetical protein